MTRTLELHRSDRVLLLAPHPDDESLAAGGLLQRAAHARAVRVVYATLGENNPWAQRASERRWRIGAADRARFGLRRRAEAERALECLGIGDSFGELGLPDRGVTEALRSDASAALRPILAEMRRFAPTILVAPAADDRHPDHASLAILATLATAAAAEHGIRPRVLRFVVHGRQPSPKDTATVTLWLTEAERLRKREAIECHATQLVLSRSRFLAFARSTERFHDDAAFVPARPQVDDRIARFLRDRARVLMPGASLAWRAMVRGRGASTG